MFKKAILTAALVTIAAPSFGATWNTNEALKVIHVKEGITAITGAGVAASDGVLTLGAEYAANDLVTITSSIAKATNASWPTSIVSAVPTAAITGCLINGGNVAVGSTALTLDNCSGAGLSVGDYIDIGGKGVYRIATATSATAQVIAAPGLVAAIADNDVVTLIKKKKVTLTLVSNTSTSATYRVSSIAAVLAGGGVSGATSTIGAPLVFQTPNLNAAALAAAGTASLTSSAQTGAGTAMDINASGVVVASTVAGFTYVVNTAFDGAVSVDLNRKSFTGGTPQADVFDYTTTAATGTAGRDGAGTAVTAVAPALTSTSLAITAATGWDFLDTGAAAGIQLNAANKVNVETVDNPATLTFDATGKVMTFADTAVRTDHTITVTKAAGATSNALPAQTYSTVMTVKATPSTGALTTYTYSAAGGAWTLNAASISAYGVPFGSTVSRFLWINNTGSTAGDISATFTQGGTTTDLGSIGTAAVKASTEIGSLIDAALVTAGVTPGANSRANLAVVVTSPSADITMSAAYKVNSADDRLIIETSDSLD